MKIQIQLDQNDIEAAIRDYLAKQGMNGDVDTINFSVPKGAGKQIEATLTQGDAKSVPAGPVKRAAPKKAEKEPEVVDEPVAADPEAEAKEDKPPFEPDTAAADDNAKPETDKEPVKESRRLFG